MIDLRAVVLEKDGISYKEAPYPQIGPTDVIINVAYCGVCGSDYPRILEGKVKHFPIILGHEFSGVVHEIGDNVKTIKKGDKVACIPLIPCFECNACKKGYYSLCSNYKFIGSRVNGGYAEYVCIPEKNVLKLPNDVNLKNSAMIEPCTVSRHVFTMADVKNKTVAVIGSGLIGLFAVQWAKILGSSKAVLITHGKKNLDSTIVGCDMVIPDDESENLKAELIIDCAGTNDSIVKAFKIADVKSTIVLVGTPKKDLSFSIEDWEMINRKEIKMMGSWMSYSADFPGVEWFDSVCHIEEMCSKVDLCIDKKYIELENIDSIFDHLRDKGNKKIVLFNKNFNCDSPEEKQ